MTLMKSSVVTFKKNRLRTRVSAVAWVRHLRIPRRRIRRLLYDPSLYFCLLLYSIVIILLRPIQFNPCSEYLLEYQSRQRRTELSLFLAQRLETRILNIDFTLDILPACSRHVVRVVPRVSALCEVFSISEGSRMPVIVVVMSKGQV